ncbi:Endonuclease/exonuclease/phosphatase superfamily [Sesbania bispinosa]|nr:Endonuclease/exonuclease/phosphatase superfamily [Sesbania bispinosa]
MELFRLFLNDTGLMDMDLKGCKFTWFSNPRNGFVTKERLDRVLVNWLWRSLYENALLMAIPAISSDHSPLIFWPKPPSSSGKSFKYEAMWEEHEECDNVIKEGWYGESDQDDVWGNFQKRATNCRRALQRWHARTFKGADRQLSKLKQKLQELLDANNSGQHWVEIQDLKEKIASLWK